MDSTSTERETETKRDPRGRRGPKERGDPKGKDGGPREEPAVYLVGLCIAG